MDKDLWPCRWCKGEKAHKYFCTDSFRRDPQRTLRSQKSDDGFAATFREADEQHRQLEEAAQQLRIQRLQADLQVAKNTIAAMAPPVTTATPTPTTSSISNTAGSRHASGSGPPAGESTENRYRRERDEAREQEKRLTQEINQLKADAAKSANASVTGTPSKPPPISANTQGAINSAMQAMLEHNTNQLKAVLETVGGGGSGQRLAAHALQLPKLQNHSSVTMHTFRSWETQMILYAEATGLSHKSFATRMALLLSSLHEDWEPIVTSNEITFEPDLSFQEMIDKIGTWVKERRNALLDRSAFLHRKMREGENSDAFFTSLHHLFRSCRYEDEVIFPLEQEDFENLMLRDTFISGLADHDMRRYILERRLEALDLDTTKSLARQYESSRATSNKLETKRIQATRKDKSAYKKGIQHNLQQRRGNPPPQHGESQPPPRASHNNQPKQQEHHYRQTGTQAPRDAYHRACLTTHATGNVKQFCPAVSHKCTQCHTVGHFEGSEYCSAHPRPGNSAAGTRPKIRALRLQQPDHSADGGRLE